MIETQSLHSARGGTLAGRPRLGFAGVGWIGRHRLQAVARSGLAEVAAYFDPVVSPEAAAALSGMKEVSRFEDLLGDDIDAVVIATPNALHAAQAITALRAGKAVFCQKPLARSAAETRLVLQAAREADRLLGVDLSYRFTQGMQRIRELITRGTLGNIYAAELKFHNAYGPDKPWFYDPARSGGGCLLDLGIHLVDLALWCLQGTGVKRVSGLLLSGGKPLEWARGSVEDYASALIELSSGTSVQLACSWRAPAGCEADIQVNFFGEYGGASFRNLNGSFYDFTAEHFLPDRSRRQLTEPPDEWGGGAILDWVRKLSVTPRFSPEAEELFLVAETLDQIYGRRA